MSIDVTGPLGEKVKAEYGLVVQSRTAIIEISAAAGITLVPADKKNPLNPPTYGVGEIISDAIIYIESNITKELSTENTFA